MYIYLTIIIGNAHDKPSWNTMYKCNLRIYGWAFMQSQIPRVFVWVLYAIPGFYANLKQTQNRFFEQNEYYI